MVSVPVWPPSVAARFWLIAGPRVARSCQPKGVAPPLKTRGQDLEARKATQTPGFPGGERRASLVGARFRFAGTQAPGVSEHGLAGSPAGPAEREPAGHSARRRSAKCRSASRHPIRRRGASRRLYRNQESRHLGRAQSFEKASARIGPRSSRAQGRCGNGLRADRPQRRPHTRLDRHGFGPGAGLAKARAALT